MTIPGLYGYRYNAAIGRHLGDCWVLVERSGRFMDWHWDQCTGFIARWQGDVLRVHRRRRAWLQRMWASPSGTLYSAEGALGHESGLFVGRPNTNDDYEWVRAPVAGLVQGVFGLADDYVLAWGRRTSAPPFVVLWNGREWRELGAPGIFLDLHATRPDLVFGVGVDGLIARFDGARWTEMDPPLRMDLGSVHVVSDDEVYATGAHAVFEGSVHGWLLRSSVEGIATNLVKWRGELYIGSGGGGLARVGDEIVEIVEPNLQPTSLHAGDVLLCCDRELLWARDADGGLAVRGLEPLIAYDRAIDPSVE